MSKVEFFEVNDFLVGGIGSSSSTVRVGKAVELANTKLERESVVVYSCRLHKQKACGLWTDEDPPGSKNTHTALLIDIQPIKTCEHPAEKVKEVWDKPPTQFGSTVVLYWQCQCGARVTPVAFKKIEGT